MKILMTPVGTLGDVKPLLSYGNHLRKMGHDIIVCSTMDCQDIVEQYHFPFYPIPLDFKKICEINEKVMGSPLIGVKNYVSILKNFLITEFDLLFDLTAQVDFVISSSLQISALSISEYYQIPYRHILFTLNWVPSQYYPPPIFKWQFKKAKVNRFLWALFKRFFNFNYQFINNQRKKMGLPGNINLYEEIEKKAVISADPGIFPLKNDSSVKRQVPYLFLNDDRQLPEEVLDFVKSGDCVYVGFGSMPFPQNERLIDMIIGVLREAGLKVIICQGWYDLKIAHKDPDVFITGPCNHDLLFSRMKFVIHHGGAGTLHTALKAGVPQLIIPLFLDQFFWAEELLKTGVGPAPLHLSRLNEVNLRNKVESILNNPEYKKRALYYAGKIETKRNFELWDTVIFDKTFL